MAWANTVAIAAPAVPRWKTAHKNAGSPAMLNTQAHSDCDKWCVGVAKTTENTADQVVSYDDQHTAAADPDIIDSFLEGFLRRIHHTADPGGKDHHNDGHYHCNYGKHENCSSYGVPAFFPFFHFQSAVQAKWSFPLQSC